MQTHNRPDEPQRDRIDVPSQRILDHLRQGGLPKYSGWQIIQPGSDPFSPDLSAYYAPRQLYAVAGRVDSDDFLCLEEGRRELVVIHHYSAPGFNEGATFKDIEDWLEHEVHPDATRRANVLRGGLDQVLDALMTSDRYQQNLDWGKPRRGHPEGTLRAHLADLEENLGHISHLLDPVEERMMRVLIHSHDTFKKNAEPRVPIDHPKSHATLAAGALRSLQAPLGLPTMAQNHDLLYSLYRSERVRGAFNERRMADLIGSISNIDMFVIFTEIDTLVPGKSSEPVTWSIERLEERGVQFAPRVHVARAILESARGLG